MDRKSIDKPDDKCNQVNYLPKMWRIFLPTEHCSGNEITRFVDSIIIKLRFVRLRLCHCLVNCTKQQSIYSEDEFEIVLSF